MKLQNVNLKSNPNAIEFLAWWKEIIHQPSQRILGITDDLVLVSWWCANQIRKERRVGFATFGHSGEELVGDSSEEWQRSEYPNDFTIVAFTEMDGGNSRKTKEQMDKLVKNWGADTFEMSKMSRGRVALWLDQGCVDLDEEENGKIKYRMVDAEALKTWFKILFISEPLANNAFQKVWNFLEAKDLKNGIKNEAALQRRVVL